MKDVMIDFETLGKSSEAVVIQIGACYFDRYNGASANRQLLINVDPRTYKQYGLKHDIDADTVMWWLAQPKEAQEKILSSNIPTHNVADAFVLLANFVRDAEHIWSHITFDQRILEATLDQLEIRRPYKYTSPRDLRTLVDLAGYDYKSHKFQGVRHSALDDCLHQISYAVPCFKKIHGVL